MTVMPTESVSGGNGIFSPTASTGADIAQTQSDGQMFMQLMVEQMKYQDPLNPVDSTQMLTQQAQFTQLQSIQEIQDEMGMMLSTQLAFGATAMIGQSVYWTGDDGSTTSGTVQGTTFTPNGPVLTVDGKNVPMTSVVSVGTPPVDTSTGSTPVDGGVGPTPVTPKP